VGGPTNRGKAPDRNARRRVATWTAGRLVVSPGAIDMRVLGYGWMDGAGRTCGGGGACGCRAHDTAGGAQVG
jgi:hypothetical protein